MISETTQKNLILTFIILLLAFFFLMQTLIPGKNIPTSQAMPGEINLYLSNGDLICVNTKDQYSITLPADLKPDLSNVNTGIYFEREDLKVEIYSQPLSETLSSDSYLNYSNQFLNNTKDHKKEREYMKVFNDQSFHILQWSREKLSQVTNDRNYYVCADLISKSDQMIYTILIKSSQPLQNAGDYESILKTFHLGTTNLDVDQADVEAFTYRPIIATPIQSIAESSWNQETAKVYERYFSYNSPLIWGIFEPSAPADFGVLYELEEALQYEFPFLIQYKHIRHDFSECTLEAAMENAKKENRIVELTLQTTASEEGESLMVYDILNGEYDAYFDYVIDILHKMEMPVLIRFCNEMNGDWCSYSSYHTSRDPDIFVHLYQYVYQYFEERDALQYTIWVWNPNEKSFPDFKWNDANLYYPGDEYVDVIGLTGYNTGNYYKGESWRSFNEIYEDIYKKAVNEHNKPLMITEFASSSIGGNKEEWIRDMFLQIKKYDRIKVAIWWNGRDLDSAGNVARPYWLDETDETKQVFKEQLSHDKSMKKE